MSPKKAQLFMRRMYFIYLALLLLALMMLSVFFIRDSTLKALNNQTQQLSYARQDFDAGVLRLLLDNNGLSAWQTELGTERFRQALRVLDELALQYQTEIGNTEQLLNEVKNELAQLLATSPADKAAISQHILACRLKLAELNSYFSEKIADETRRARFWFNITVFSALILVFGLFISLASNEKKRALYHRQLYNSQRYLALIADNIDEVFWLKDARTNQLLYLSSAFEKLWQLSLQDVTADPQCWWQRVHPEDVSAVSQAITQAKQEMVSVEFRIVLPNGKVKWLCDRIFPISTLDENGDNLELNIVIESDITQAKQLNEQLSSAQKLESLGKLTGGIAHDFNNLLTVIMGNAQLIKDMIPAHSQLAEVAALIVKASERGATLNRQLLAFASKQQLQPERIELAALLPDMLVLLRSTIGQQIRVNFNERERDICCVADAGQLQNAIINLCLNARDAMPDGGIINIELATSADKSFAEITVTDNGHGIADDILPHIFEPFFTTKDRENGTGLGLSMVYGFVRQSGGDISVTSKVAVGTTFKISLPLCQAPSSKSIPDRYTEKSERVRVLLVEDDDMVRESILAMFGAEHYFVMSVADAGTALSVLAEQHDIHIVISDIKMPGEIDGIKLAQIITAKYPMIKIVLISGYVGSLQDKYESFSNYVFLAKPFGKKQLMDTLSQLN